MDVYSNASLKSLNFSLAIVNYLEYVVSIKKEEDKKAETEVSIELKKPEENK